MPPAAQLAWLPVLALSGMRPLPRPLASAPARTASGVARPARRCATTWCSAEAELTQAAEEMGIGGDAAASPLSVVAPMSRYAADEPFAMVELTAGGQINRYQSTLTSMHATEKLSTRDVRLLRSSTSVLVVREGSSSNYILFDFGDLRGVLQHDRVTLVGAGRPAVLAVGSEIQQRLALSRGEDAPFEVRVLECVLELTHAILDDSLRRLSALVSSTLAELSDSEQGANSERRRGEALSRLLPMQISLNSLQAKARRYVSVLEEVLESDDDMADMCLSLLHRRAAADAAEERGEDHSEPAAEVSFLEAEVAARAGSESADREASELLEEEQERIEELLDVYLARFESLTDRIETLASEIETTQGVLELTLDNERNRIARLELVLSMAGLSIGGSAMVSGFFGMNLLSGVESAAGLFWYVTAMSVSASLVLFGTCWRRYRSLSRQQRSRLNDVQALKHVLVNLDTVALLLRNRPALPSGLKPMQETIKSLLAESGLKQWTEREIFLLCTILMRQQVDEKRAASLGIA